MPRTLREKSKNGIYHAILRGEDRQALFQDDDDDKCLYLGKLQRFKQGS